MIIFMRELARNKKSFIIWTVIIILMDLLQMSMFPSIAESKKAMDEMLKSLPKELLSAFGMDKLSMADVMGYFATQVYLFVTLFGSIYVMLLASIILSKEEGDKTIEFLLSKPVTRNTIVTSKLLCAAFYILVFNAIISVTNYIFIEVFKKGSYDFNNFILLCIAPLLLHMVFASIGFFMSVFITKTKSVYPIVIGIVIGTYFLSIISGISEKMKNLKYLSPFKYVDPTDIVLNKRFDVLYLSIMLGVVVIMAVSSYIIYNRKNISV